MQSGITASSELQDAFSAFTSDSTRFALPVTINGESLTPLPSIPWSSDNFEASLPALAEHLLPKTPIYLLLRKSPNSSTDLVAVTYVPSIAPVRSKMLFASTRASLVRDLGLEKFGDTLFATDAEEVLEHKQWQQRASSATATKSGPDTAILTQEERELQSVKRAEEEERHGTQGRDLMGEGGSGGGLKMKIENDARSALAQLTAQGAFVQLGIDLSSETIVLLSSHDNVEPSSISSTIPADRPSYSFYRYPSTDQTIFIYTCPGTSKVKERMMYASSRHGVLELAKAEGVSVSKRLEAGDPDEVGQARLSEELGLTSGASEPAANKGFARPKRPGKR